MKTAGAPSCRRFFCALGVHQHGWAYNRAVEVETDRLRLRHWREDDFESYAAFYADDEMCRFIGGHCSRFEAWRRFAIVVGHWALRGFGLWAVEERDSRRFVGCIGLQHPVGWPELEVGYWVVRDMQHKGYATEAAAASRDYAFDTLEASTVVSYIDPRNKPSIRVAERIGAVPEGIVALPVCGEHRIYRHRRAG